MTLRTPPLAQAPVRPLGANAHSAVGRRYLETLTEQQDALVAQIHAAVPSARVRWRYRLVLDAVAVVVPRSALQRLSRLPGVATVEPATGYAPALDVSVPLIGAPQLWGPTLSSAGQGIKIGIVDDGIDQTHPFFDAKGYAYPPGFPKGDKRYTTPKVIVARSFPAPTLAVHRDLPFDPENSEHGTHVSGIAAGDDGTVATLGSATTLAGVAPRAYLGNYKVMSVPTPQFGIDGNSPEIAAGIEAAVADGMDVINLSLGEPEVTQSRDLVVRAIEGATKLGVVTTVAAGNDYSDYGDGSVDSPATAPSAISVAASGDGKGIGVDRIADFSSGGPTPISLQLKPDVAAPGVQILSSLPRRDGLWAAWEGTSMAAPHVAGAVALLLQRHPTWTPAQVKSALVLTGKPVSADGNSGNEVSPLREGGGRIDLPGADVPLVFAAPTNVSFGLIRPGAKLSRELALADAGGGAGTWEASAQLITSVDGVTVTVPTQVSVPGAFVLGAAVPVGAHEGDEAGFIVLRNGAGTVRRIPFWFRVERPRLASEGHRLLKRPGLYAGNTRGKAARVTSYRYPARAPGEALQVFPGPEQAFRFTVGRGVANAGVVLLSGGAVPHLVAAGDENRMTGAAGLPINIDPYRNAYGLNEGVAGVELPAAGSYDAVFDTPSGGRPGPFRFRFWVNDTKPPTVRVVAARVAAGKPLTVRITDAGSGVDPHVLAVKLDGKAPPSTTFDPARGLLTLSTEGVTAGTHELAIEASDYQEAKNMENTGPVLPNTRFFKATVTVT